MDARLLTTPCTILSVTAGTGDEYGDPTITESSMTTRCHIEQASGDEIAGRSIEETIWKIWLPADAELDGTDSIAISGQRYQLTEDPWPVKRPSTGLVDHFELLARRTR